MATTAAVFAVQAPADNERTYLIEMYNAFGVVEGSDVRVAGVNAGSVTSLDVNSAKRAVVEVSLSGPLAVLGEDTTCSTEPQSLIAEYFIDCEPDGPEMETSGDPEDPDVTAENVSQTVQNDLVNNTLREPFKRRLQLLINEFGTALAGNPDNLNEAIRLGAPALTSLEKVLSVLGKQNTIIRDLNVDSDRIIARLTERREDVVAFIEEARDTAAASAERRDDLGTDFALLDDFLAELNPTLVELEAVAREHHAAVHGPARLGAGPEPADDQPPGVQRRHRRLARLAGRGIRGRARRRSSAARRRSTPSPTPARRRHRSARCSPTSSATSTIRAERSRSTPRAADVTGRSAPTGYTGLEGLLNYAYFQSASTNQFDQVGHLLHFSLYYVFSGPCGAFTTGRNPETGAIELPNKAGGTTTTPGLIGPDSTQINNCVAWLGAQPARHQPGPRPRRRTTRPSARTAPSQPRRRPSCATRARLSSGRGPAAAAAGHPGAAGRRRRRRRAGR